VFMARRLGCITGSPLILLAVLGACSIHATQRAAPQPVALANLNGHQAVVITKPGTYILRSFLMDFVGHPSPELALSDDICNYLAATVVSVGQVPSNTVNGAQKETMVASLRVNSLRQPVILGYQFDYALLGPSVVSLDGRAALSCLRRLPA
jgi:hypothetical protein